MEKPTAQDVYQMMENAIGEDKMSPAMKQAYKVAPSLLVDHGLSCNQSILSEENALDKKTSVLVFLSASLAFKDDACINAFVQMCDGLGITNDELISVIRIVRHAASSGVIGSSQALLDYIADRK
jgi:alkylhydroperoxidase/carboxymuconolactone decarboxylase family protein YurZ